MPVPRVASCHFKHWPDVTMEQKAVRALQHPFSPPSLPWINCGSSPITLAIVCPESHPSLKLDTGIDLWGALRRIEESRSVLSTSSSCRRREPAKRRRWPRVITSGHRSLSHLVPRQIQFGGCDSSTYRPPYCRHCCAQSHASGHLPFLRGRVGNIWRVFRSVVLSIRIVKILQLVTLL